MIRLKLPDLGDPNAPESFSVWGIDVSKENPEVVSKVKTGVLVGQEVEGISAVGGSSPNSMVATDKFVYVSNGNNDNISVIDVKQDTVVSSIELKLDERLGNLKGVIPFGLTLSPDQKRLYVAEAGINAVGVIDVETQTGIGSHTYRMVSFQIKSYARWQATDCFQRKRIWQRSEWWQRFQTCF